MSDIALYGIMTGFIEVIIVIVVHISIQINE